MKEIGKLERASLGGKEYGYIGRSIAIGHRGHEFVVLAADDATIKYVWDRLFHGEGKPIDFKRVINGMIVRADAVEVRERPAPDALTGMEGK